MVALSRFPLWGESFRFETKYLRERSDSSWNLCTNNSRMRYLLSTSREVIRYVRNTETRVHMIDMHVGALEHGNMQPSKATSCSFHSDQKPTNSTAISKLTSRIAIIIKYMSITNAHWSTDGAPFHHKINIHMHAMNVSRTNSSSALHGRLCEWERHSYKRRR